MSYMNKSGTSLAKKLQREVPSSKSEISVL